MHSILKKQDRIFPCFQRSSSESLLKFGNVLQIHRVHVLSSFIDDRAHPKGACQMQRSLGVGRDSERTISEVPA